MIAGGDSAPSDLLGELHEIYYNNNNNKDLRLLLDLLSATSDLAPPLRVMALLDNTFRSQCRPLVVSLDRTNKNGDGDIVVVFSEAKMVRPSSARWRPSTVSTPHRSFPGRTTTLSRWSRSTGTTPTTSSPCPTYPSISGGGKY